MPPDLALLSTLTGSNYICLELIFMVPKVFEPLKFNCNHDTSRLCIIGHDNIYVAYKNDNSRFHTLSYFPLMVSDAILCPLHDLNTFWYIILILYSYVEPIKTMCGVQVWQLSFSYLMSYYPLIISDAISCPLHYLKTLGILS